jgi:NAD(P)-dependent dehydrogenase (short-subunit alcohol dehydrogenase family)
MGEKVINTSDHSTVHSPASENLLIIGGTSSLSKYICELALSDGWAVYSTFRNENKRFLPDRLNWIHLNFEDLKSVEIALSQLDKVKFKKIIYLVGEISGIQNIEPFFSDLDSYFKRNISVPVWFLKYLLFNQEFGEGSTFTYMSSRASQLGSNDFCYGIAKAAIENFVKSLSLLPKLKIKFRVLHSGLILGSGMQKRMPPEIVKVHMDKSGDGLIDISLAANQIWQFSNFRELATNLEVLEVGIPY